MNLAEIRKKARSDQVAATPTTQRAVTIGEIPGRQHVPESSSCESEAPHGSPGAGTPLAREAALQCEAHEFPADMDPLAVLLAGRRSACLTTIEETDESPDSGSFVHKYLRFTVAGEEYGLSLMEIREIIKPRPVTLVPRMPKYVSGVISLRGLIVPVFDLRQRLGFPVGRHTGLERIIIVRKESGSCGLLVDEIYQVISLADSAIDKAPPVFDGIARDFVKAIGNLEGKVVTLLSIEHVLDVTNGY